MVTETNESSENMSPKVWKGDYVAEKLGISISDPENADQLSVKETIGLALRHNPRRAHLLVSELLGKHIPASPSLILRSGETLALLAYRALGGNTEPYPWLLKGIKDYVLEGQDSSLNLMNSLLPEITIDAVCVGYAETATSLGYIVANALNVPYIHSTRYGEGRTAYGKFEEAHSHATSHQLVPDDKDFLNNDLPLILVDDEISTGKTIIATIEELHNLSPRKHYVACALIDCRTDKDIANMEALADKYDIKIDVVSLAKGEVTLPDTILEDAKNILEELPQKESYNQELFKNYRSGLRPHERPYAHMTWDTVDISTFKHARYGVTSFDEINGIIENIDRNLPLFQGKTLVLGIEEFMYLPLRLAAYLEEKYKDSDNIEIYSSSSTRSPVVVHDDPSYAVRSKLSYLTDTKEERFIYNIEGFDTIIVILEPGQTAKGNIDLIHNLSQITYKLRIIEGETIDK